MTYDELDTLLGRRSEVDVPCPLCSPIRKRPHQRLRVLHIWRMPEKGALITFNCVHCGEHGGIRQDGEIVGLTWRELQELDERRRRQQQADDAKRVAGARQMLAAGVPARGTIAEAYFERRGLDVPEALWRQLCFDPDHSFGSDGRHPAVLMPFRDLTHLKVTGIHRIALTPLGDGARRADGRKLKKSSGLIHGAAMMWQRIGAEVTVTEGLETALGVAMGGIARGGVVAVSGTSFLVSFKAPFQVGLLVIAADHDAAGVKAAEDCEKSNNCDVEILMPDIPGTDFADQFRRGGPDGKATAGERGESAHGVQD